MANSCLKRGHVNGATPEQSIICFGPGHVSAKIEQLDVLFHLSGQGRDRAPFLSLLPIEARAADGDLLPARRELGVQRTGVFSL